MKILVYLWNPAIIGLIALLLSIVWMLRDERDKTRPVLVIALVINLFYGFVLNVVMGQENGLVPWKYDHVLAGLDQALGLASPMVAPLLQGALRLPLFVIYQLMVPMMIVWCLVQRYRNGSGSVVLAYIAEMLTGPLLYAVLPACGPAYAFRAHWLNPPAVQAEVVRLSGMPNAFPSLHVGTAIVFVFFAQGKLWRTVSLAMLAGTAMATISTGEHYVIDLVAGVAFGCFAASVGYRRVRSAALYFGIALGWSLAVRFGFETLIGHPWLVRSLSIITLALGIRAVAGQWRTMAATATAPPAFGESGHEGHLRPSALSS
jgi:hypothetical protein